MNTPRTTMPRQLRDAFRRLLLTFGALDDTRRPCGTPLPMPHAYALLELRAGPLTVGELASRLSIDRTNVSRLCARMERNGELTRARDPDDARARRLTLTDRGQDLAGHVDAASAGHFEAVLGRLEDAPTVIDAIDALTAAMAAPSGEPS